MVRTSYLLDLSQIGLFLSKNMTTASKEPVLAWTKQSNPARIAVDPDLQSLIAGLANGSFSSEALTKVPLEFLRYCKSLSIP